MADICKNDIVITSEALNEAENIGLVFERVPKGYGVILVDDGSTDNTASIGRVYPFVKVISHAVNLGQGVAFVTGLKAAIDLGYRYMIHMDSDGQHKPEDIPRFEEALRAGGGDIVVGSRILGQMNKTTFLRRSFLPVLARIINGITKYEMSDPMCGFRGYDLDVIRMNLGMFANYHNPQYNAVEMFIRASRRGIRVKEIPVSVDERSSGSSYKGELRYGWNVMVSIIKTYLEGVDK